MHSLNENKKIIKPIEYNILYYYISMYFKGYFSIEYNNMHFVTGLK